MTPRLLATVDVPLEEGTAYSALALGYLNPAEAPADTPFQLVLTEDASFSLELPSVDEMTDNETTTEEEATTTEEEATTVA